MKNFYEILGVTESSTEDDIKKSFKNLAKKYHPDLNKEHDAEKNFKDINEAYDTLKDPNKRAQYDDMLRFGPGGPSRFEFHFGGGGPGGPGGNGMRWGNVHGRGGPSPGFPFDEIFGDPFEQIFRHHHQQATRKNKDIHVKYPISFEDAFTGKKAEIKYRSDSSLNQVILDIPPGVNPGSRMSFPGKGEKNISHLPPGDLQVTIVYQQHQHFSLNDNNLIYTAAIDYIDAILGTEVKVPLIEGGHVDVSIPAGVSNGQYIKISGKGMRIFRSTGRGDLLINILLTTPKLNSSQLELLKSIKHMR